MFVILDTLENKLSIKADEPCCSTEADEDEEAFQWRDKPQCRLTLQTKSAE